MLSLFLSRPKTGDPIVSTHVAHALRALNCLKEEADCHDGELDPLDLGFDDGNIGGTQDTEPNEAEGQRLTTTTVSMIPQASSQGTFTNPSSQVILDPSSTSTSFSLETSRHLRNFRDSNSRQSNSRNKIEQVILESRDQNMKFKNYLIERDNEKEKREERERKRKRKEKNKKGKREKEIVNG